MADGRHGEPERFARGRDRFAVWRRHWARECSGHDPGDGSIVTRADSDGVRCNVGVGGVDEHAFEIVDVPGDPVGLVPIRPRHDDVIGVTLRQSVPLLVAEYVKIVCVVGGEAYGTLGGLRFARRAARQRSRCADGDKRDSQYHRDTRRGQRECVHIDLLNETPLPHTIPGFFHRSIGFAIPFGRNGSMIFRPSPADAYAAYNTSCTTRPVSPSETGASFPRTHRAKWRISWGKP